MKTYWGSGGIDSIILDLGRRWKWVVSFTPRSLYSQRKSPWYLLDMRLGGFQSRSGRGGEEKNSQARKYRKFTSEFNSWFGNFHYVQDQSILNVSRSTNKDLIRIHACMHTHKYTTVRSKSRAIYESNTLWLYCILIVHMINLRFFITLSLNKIMF
jgi:hypothetical protein